MIKRNGSTFRTLLIAVVLVALIYFIYLYNGVQSSLRNSEIVSEKLKRDRESLSSQLNDISLEKEHIKEKYQKERLEIISKLTDMQSKYKMLQSQHQDMETEYSKIRGKLEKFTEDSKQKDANRNEEFMQLKQEKEMEIIKLKDLNANLFRESEQYKSELINLKQQLQQQQKENFDGWNQVGQLKKSIETLQNKLMDTGGGSLGGGNLQFAPHNQQQQQQQQQILQQQPIQQQQILQQHLLQKHGLFNDIQNGNSPLGRILHQPPNNQFGQPAQMGHAANLPDHALPAKRDAPVENEQFQIPPANIEHNAADSVKSNHGKGLVLQKEEAEQRKQQESEHNQVQPPINNEPVENNLNKNEKKELDDDEQEEAEREQIFQILNRQRHGKRSENFAAENPVVPPALNGNGKRINGGQPPPFRVNVEDKLAGRDSANENHQFFEAPREMIGENLQEIKDGGEHVKKSQKGNKRQKISRNNDFDNALLGDEKELQMQHPNDFDAGNKKGNNNDDQYYDEEEDDAYQ